MVSFRTDIKIRTMYVGNKLNALYCTKLLLLLISTCYLGLGGPYFIGGLVDKTLTINNKILTY